MSRPMSPTPPARLLRQAIVGLAASSLGLGGAGPEQGAWQATSSVEVPTARQLHTAVWTGSRMIIWGGDEEGADSATGGVFDPATNEWTPLSADASQSRFLHTAVWTSSKMVVWGGERFPFYLASGAIYDPQDGSWTPTSTLDAPQPRSGHSAVWTGTRMIVWGGAGNPGPFLATGGLYDPEAGHWAGTATADAPEPRFLHATVWTGSRMIVWGGAALSGALASGGVYDPTGDAWTPTATEGAPSARYEHTSVWTGSRMIVWGGYDGGAPTATGASYDPATKKWAQISGDGAPAARFRHRAVWTGSKMIVWGGFGSGFLDSGGIYDPEADAWSPTSAEGAPAGRFWHSAVWTGSKMVVWGGMGAGSFKLNTGGLYSSAATEEPFLTVPIDGSVEIGKKLVSAVLDHHVPTGYNCNASDTCGEVVGTETVYHVLAFDGSRGSASYGSNGATCPPPGYRMDSQGTRFDFTPALEYVGIPSVACGGTSYLNYDGHPGYDFAYAEGRAIIAAADGILEVPVEDPVNNRSGSSPQQTYNTLKISHSNGLETWYLHARVGSECVAFGSCPGRPVPGQQVAVVRRQRIAEVGRTSPIPIGAHLHFEVRRTGSESLPSPDADRLVVDPFGCDPQVRDVHPHACLGRLWVGDADEPAGAQSFFTLEPPCRLVDTRSPPAPMRGGETRAFTVAGRCGIPHSARAVALNVTVVGPSSQGHLRVYPRGEPPVASTINFSAGQVRSNNAILPLGDSSGLLVTVTIAGGGSLQVVLDAAGYFE